LNDEIKWFRIFSRRNYNKYANTQSSSDVSDTRNFSNLAIYRRGPRNIIVGGGKKRLCATHALPCDIYLYDDVCAYIMIIDLCRHTDLGNGRIVLSTRHGRRAVRYWIAYAVAGRGVIACLVSGICRGGRADRMRRYRPWELMKCGENTSTCKRTYYYCCYDCFTYTCIGVYLIATSSKHDSGPITNIFFFYLFGYFILKYVGKRTWYLNIRYS